MANTPFLDLVKPAGTDKALVSVLNSNSDKIDTGVSTLSEQIATYNCGSKTVQEFVAAIEQLGSTMADRGVKNIFVQISSASAPFEQATYTGTLRRNYSDRYDVILFTNASTKTIVGAKSSGGWSWQQFETVEDVNNRFNNKVSYTTAYDITLKSGASCYYYLDRVGRSIYGDVVFIADSAVSANTVIAHATGVSNALGAHVSANGSSGSPGRFRFTTSGSIICENALPANEWFSFSFVALYNTGV